jgi:hypothetical protein
MPVRSSGISHLAIRIYFEKSKQVINANGVSIELTLGFETSPDDELLWVWARQDNRSGLSIQGTTLRTRLAAKLSPPKKRSGKTTEGREELRVGSIFCVRATDWRARTIGASGDRAPGGGPRYLAQGHRAVGSIPVAR